MNTCFSCNTPFPRYTPELMGISWTHNAIDLSLSVAVVIPLAEKYLSHISRLWVRERGGLGDEGLGYSR
jgi:hypothetical protein